jgi:hypothetical protein
LRLYLYVLSNTKHTNTSNFLLTWLYSQVLYLYQYLSFSLLMMKMKINSCAKSAWYARHQHSYNICKDFLSHNSWMKNLNFINSCTINMNWNIYTIFIQLKTTFFEKSVKTINSNNSTKFEVNWPRGSQFTAWHTKNRLQFDE